MESKGIKRNQQESNRIKRNQIESKGIKWNQKESKGIKRNHQESTGIKSNQNESKRFLVLKITCTFRKFLDFLHSTYSFLQGKLSIFCVSSLDMNTPIRTHFIYKHFKVVFDKKKYLDFPALDE
jgi:hypothetical protein